MELEEAKKEVSEILRKVIHVEEVYYLDGKYVRWGRVEKDLHAVLESFLTQRAADSKTCEQTFHQLMKLQGKLFCCDCGVRL